MEEADTKLRKQVERNEDWRARAMLMPYLRFPEGWEVAVIPPFRGAMARIRVRKGDTVVSVFADVGDIDFDEEPYWEIHPGASGEPETFALNDVDGLIAGIDASLTCGS